MPWYEVVYETGNMSVGNYADDEEAKAAIGEQDKRAREGGQAGPQGGPAERVVKIYKYSKPPNDYNPDQTATADVLKSEVGALVDGLADANGVVNIAELSMQIQALSHPMQAKENPFDSQFKMEHESELTLDSGETPSGGKGSK